jgi:hypothetical protein
MSRLFISYSRDDRAWVTELWRALRDATSLEPWIDQKIIPATDWWESILSEIEKCELFVIVLTPKSVQSVYCQTELDYALALNKPVIPLILKTSVYPKQLAKRHIQYMNVADCPLDKVLITILDTAIQIMKEFVNGKYSPAKAKRPKEPNANNDASLNELFSAGIEAEESGNDDIAAQFFERVIDSKSLFRELAQDRLKSINFRLERRNAYEEIKKCVRDKRTRDFGPVVWKKFIQEYGDKPDPDNVRDLVRRVEVDGINKVVVDIAMKMAEDRGYVTYDDILGLIDQYDID